MTEKKNLKDLPNHILRRICEYSHHNMIEERKDIEQRRMDEYFRPHVGSGVAPVSYSLQSLALCNRFFNAVCESWLWHVSGALKRSSHRYIDMRGLS